MTAPNEAKPLGPQDLANQLFDLMLPMTNNDPRETARQVIVFLKEALVYSILVTAGDEVARKALLKSVGESVVNAPVPGKS